MINRLKSHKMARVLIGAMAAALLLVAVPQALVVTLSSGNTSDTVNWPLLLGNEVAAQQQAIAVDLGKIQGNVTLQGQGDHSDIEIALDGVFLGNPLADGNYSFGDIMPGSHVLRFSFPNYLSVGKTIVVNDGLTTTVPDVRLRGGDVTGNGLIDLRDLVEIAGALGSSDPGTDVNRDGVVNVRDLVFGGINFGRTAQVAHSTMDQRLHQAMAALRDGPPGAAEAAIDNGMALLYGGLRPLPSFNPATGQPLPQTIAAHKVLSEKEREFSKALGDYSGRRDAVPEIARMAFDLKLFIEQMAEVSEALGQVTRNCGVGVNLADGTAANGCDDLLPLLDENNAIVLGDRALPVNFDPILRPSYSVKLRSPLVPFGGGTFLTEDIIQTESIGINSCDTVFKEIRGLMVKLHLERVTIVRDPWVSVFNVPRGTRIPIWSLEWVPSEYVRTWEMCNVGGQIKVDMSQNIKQLEPLTFFWRFQR